MKPPSDSGAKMIYQNQTHQAQPRWVWLKLLVQQVGCFLPDLFLTAYSAGYSLNSFVLSAANFLAAYSAGYVMYGINIEESVFLAAYSAGYL